jgi:two-component system, NtrC family, sensor kinase
MPARPRPNLKFQAKVLIPVVAVMGLFLVATMWVANGLIQRQLRNENRSLLLNTETLFSNAFLRQVDYLIQQFSPIPDQGNFSAIAARLNRDPTDTTGTNTMMERFGEILRSTPVKETDVILFTDPAGQLLAATNRNNRSRTADFYAACAPLVKSALAANKTELHSIQVGDTLFAVVTTPSLDTETHTAVLGALVFGVELGSAAAQQFETPNGKIAFIANHKVVASTFSSAEVNPDLVSEAERLTAPAARAGEAEDFSLILEGEHYGAMLGKLPLFHGAGDASCLLLSSYEQPWRAFQNAQGVLFVFSVLSLVLGSGIVWLLVRRVTEPLRQLRDSAEAVGRGDFSRRIVINSNDELGELAGVFNRMTENLQKSLAQLEKTVEILRATQAQLVHSEKLSAVGEFVAGVAHELNNPLTALIGFAELVQMSEVDEDTRDSLKRISSSAERCHKIVQSLLSFARQHPPERKLTSINALVDSVIEILIYELRTSNIVVVKDLSPQLPRLLVDPHQVQQVFLNIVNNARQAIEAHRSKGSIRIITRVAGQRVQVCFQDDGPGISEENLSRIFNPFFTTKPVGKGTGLGLSLSYGIIQEHGGTIAAESKIGVGTTFIIELPITVQSEAAAQEDTPAAPPPPQGRGRKVLVVDDEEDIVRLARMVLEQLGYKVQTAHDGESALAHLGREQFDLILSDWKMPGLGGQQLYLHLLETDPAAAGRMIFMTGDVLSEKTEKFLGEHNKTCLTKPFSLVEFQRAIGETLEQQ